MSPISQFSTPENFAKLTEALDKINYAIKETDLAIQAGIPGASETLKTAQEAKQRIEQVLHTYFPEGTAPVETQ